MQKKTCYVNRLPRSLNPFGISRVLGDDWNAESSSDAADDVDEVGSCNLAVDVGGSDISFSPSSFADESRISEDHIDSIDEGDNNVENKSDETFVLDQRDADGRHVSRNTRYVMTSARSEVQRDDMHPSMSDVGFDDDEEGKDGCNDEAELEGSVIDMSKRSCVSEDSGKMVRFPHSVV